MPPAPDAAAESQKPIDAENALTDTAVVVIGRNEGGRLGRCLASLLKQPPVPMVYVNSGSSDNSVSLARKLGIDVIELDPSKPFSMARARNTGFNHLLSLHPNLRFAQFVDGDCELEPAWLFHAQHFLSNNDVAVAVCGHLRESSPKSSIYNRLADMEWQGPVGEIAACGGIAMYRASAFEALQGFNEGMIAGEEPDLCARLKQAGGQVWRLDYPMALHDAAMTRFRQWWTRTKRGGYALAYGLMAGNNTIEKNSNLQMLSTLAYGLLLPAIWIATCIYSLLKSNFFIFYLSTAIVITISLKPTFGAFNYRLKCGNTKNEAFLYAIFCTLGKIPESLGIFKFFFDFIFNKKAKLIEYKVPPS